MQMTEKDIQITISAILKSVIESGCDPSEWETRTLTGLKLFTKLLKGALKNGKDNKSGT